MGTINSKILLAFLVGAFLASGIVYVALRPAGHPERANAAVKPIYVDPAQSADPLTPEHISSPAVTAEAVPPIRELPGDHVVDRYADRHADPYADRSVDQRVDRYKDPPRSEKRSPSGMLRQVEVAQVARPAEVAQVVKPPAPVEPPSAKEDVPAIPATAPPPQPEQPATLPPAPDPPSAPAPAPLREPHTVTLRSGTLLPVRIGETLTADHNQPGDGFLATLDQPLVVDGFVIAERGARLEGRIVEADRGGRVRGTSHLTLELVKLTTADGQHVRIRTSPFDKESQPSTGSDAAKVGIGAAIGAAIGGIAGGGKGAGVGAGVGGAAGAGDVLLTRGKPATIPVETRVSFHLQEPVTLTERLR